MNTKQNHKQCPMCKVFREPSLFNDGRIQCNICREYKRKHRENHREELRQKAREYYQEIKERKREYNKQYREEHCPQMVECAVCKVQIRMSGMARHEQSKTHIHNLNNPDNPKLTFKQQHEQKLKQQEEEKTEKQLHHLETMRCLNENFPSYADPSY